MLKKIKMTAIKPKGGGSFKVPALDDVGNFIIRTDVVDGKAMRYQKMDNTDELSKILRHFLISGVADKNGATYEIVRKVDEIIDIIDSAENDEIILDSASYEWLIDKIKSDKYGVAHFLSSTIVIEKALAAEDIEPKNMI